MKRFLLLLLTAALLTGCTPETAEPTTDSRETSESTEATWPESSGLYAPGSSLEIQTEGAVKQFPLGEGTYDGIVPMGENLLLLKNGDVTTLTLLTGPDLTEAVSTKLTFPVASHTGLLQVNQKTAAYYDEKDGTLVFLNENLTETSRLQLPEDITGAPWLSPDHTAVYYCTSAGVHRLDLKTGISRQLAEQVCKYQSVTGILLDGAALRSDLYMEDGSTATRIISAETGETLWEGSFLEQLSTQGQQWLVKMDRGSVTEWIFGQQGETAENLWPAEDADYAQLLSNGTIITSVEADWGLRLDVYDTRNGKRTASVMLPGITAISDACSDGSNGVWLMGTELSSGEQMILYWDAEKSEAADGQCYTAPHYTAAVPDEAGIAQMDAQAAKLESAYGVDIRLAGEATAVTCGGYGFETEYLVPAMERYLPRLEAALALFPEGFLQTVAQKTGSGKLHICLVRSVCGSAEYGTLDTMPCVQFWKDGEAYLVVTMNDQLEQSFLHAVMHSIETRVLSVCTAYYDWERLNPSGFQYDNDYIVNRDRNDGSYLYGDSQAFIDQFSKSFAREDRAMIFAYACQAGNEACFATEAMQQKLAVLCDGIRQAFALEGESYVWEQYLRSTPTP